MLRTLKIVTIALILTLSQGSEAAGAAFEKFGVGIVRRVVQSPLTHAAVVLPRFPATSVSVRAFSADAGAGEDLRITAACAIRDAMALANAMNVDFDPATLRSIAKTYHEVLNPSDRDLGASIFQVKAEDPTNPEQFEAA